MSQLTIHLSDKADALIAQLQKEIFNRRRKKVTAAGVIETLVESGAKSQSDRRFATSWTNLVADIEKAARVAHAHGAKPANLSDEEWALVLSHRTRSAAPAPARKAAARARSSTAQRVAHAAVTADTSPIESPASTRPARTAAKVSGRRTTKVSKASRAAAPESSAAPAAAPAPRQRTTPARSTAKPAKTVTAPSSAKASAKVPAKTAAKPAVKTAAKTKTTKPGGAKPKVAESRTNASQPRSTVAKAAPKSTAIAPSPTASRRASHRTRPNAKDHPVGEGAAITSPAAATTAATPTRNRRKAGSTTTPGTRSRSPRVSAATRMAKAVSRLGATANPTPVAEPALVALAFSANGSSPTPAELA